MSEDTPDQLVLAVQALDKSFNHWVKHSKDDDFPPSLIKAIGVIGVLVTTGFPKDDRLVGLYAACVRMAGAFQAVEQEESGSARKLVAEIERVCEYLDAVEQAEVAPVQSVKSMLDEYKQDPKRYTWVARAFGEFDADEDVWRGPFFTRTGVPNQAAIEKEATEPGSILGENYQPAAHKLKMERLRAAAVKQLAGLQAGLFRPEGGAHPEKASILEQLQDGQYADVIARVSKVPLAEVLKVASDNGIKVKNRDDDIAESLGSITAKPELEAYGYEATTYDEPVDTGIDDEDVPYDVDTTDDGEPDPFDLDNVVEPEKITSEELSNIAAELYAENNDVTAQDIMAAAVQRTRKTVSRQQVAPLMKKLRQGV